LPFMRYAFPEVPDQNCYTKCVQESLDHYTRRRESRLGVPVFHAVHNRMTGFDFRVE